MSLDKFKRNAINTKSILVIGDIMLDTYFYGEVNRISPEAPVPVFKKLRERSVLGGSANVAANLSAAHQNVSVMSILGNDKAGEKLRRLFKESEIKSDLIITVNDRPTTEKIRFLASSNNQQVIRLDIENVAVFEEYNVLLDMLKGRIAFFDLILISDYMKGLLSVTFTQSIILLARQNNIPVLADVKGNNPEKYKHATLIKPNVKELSDLTGLPVDTDAQIIEASEKLRQTCYCKYVLTTCGSKGMLLVGDNEQHCNQHYNQPRYNEGCSNKEYAVPEYAVPYSTSSTSYYFIKSVVKEVFDVTGAGDTAIAYLAACIANGFSIRDAVNVANIAAGIQVSKVGTSSVYWEEIQKIQEQHLGMVSKSGI